MVIYFYCFKYKNKYGRLVNINCYFSYLLLRLRV